MCFKFLCFRHCPIPDPDPGSQLREDLIDLANQKFDHAGSSGSADYLFWKILKAEVHTHAAALKSNKKNYFHQNGLLIFFASLLGGTEKHRVLFSGIPLALASILTMFIYDKMNAEGRHLQGVKGAVGKLLAIFSVTDSETVSSVAAVIFTAAAGFFLAALSFYNLSKRSHLRLRQYGETWIRHSVALSEYELTLMRFAYDLAPYDTGTPVAQNKLFQAEILDIRKRNQKQFETNMKKMEEASA